MIRADDARQQYFLYRNIDEENFEETHKELMADINNKILESSRNGKKYVKIEISHDDFTDVEMETLEKVITKHGYSLTYISGYAFSFAFMVEWYE
jgi:hypothetical protein